MSWNDFMIEGDEIFDYMLDHYNHMFNGTNLKHCRVRYATWSTYQYCYNIQQRVCVAEIKHALYLWIMEEHQYGRLFIRQNWKPFRDTEQSSYMYLGYNKLFIYQNYYFQLVMDSACSINNCEDCDKCNRENDMIDNGTHFDIALFGWKENNSDILHPYNIIVKIVNDIMPLYYWRRE